MRFFAYQGTDYYGRPIQGTIQANGADIAERLLQEGGVRVAKVQELTPQGATPPAPQPVPAPAARPAPTRGTAARSVSTPVVPKASTTPPRAVTPPQAQTQTAARTSYPPRDMGNKTAFFFFEALARYLRSGVAANRALEELGQRARNPWAGERLLWASGAVAQGMGLADALEGCACFPTGTVGMVRAGEMSGALPDACMQAAEGCERAHRLRLKCAFMAFFFVLAAIYLPIGLGLVHGSLDTISDQWEHDGQLPAVATASKHMMPIVGRNLLIALPFYLGALVLWRLWLTPRMRMARHRTIMKTPVLAGRAREESLARTSWALTELSRAGLSPARSLVVAADAAPNLEIARRFREEAGRMREHDRLSTALRSTGLLDPQLVDVVENGELAGDVPGAVASVHRTTDAEFQRKDGSAHTRIWAILYPIVGILIALMLRHLYVTLITGYFERIQ